MSGLKGILLIMLLMSSFVRLRIEIKNKYRLGATVDCGLTNRRGIGLIVPPFLDRNNNKIMDCLESKLIGKHNDPIDVIIVCKSGKEAEARKRACGFGISIVRRFRIINGILIRSKASRILRFLKKFENLYMGAEEDAKAYIEGSIGPIYHNSFVGSYEECSITVAIVDSGIDASHVDLRGRLVYYRDLTGESTEPIDNIGHGTMVASIIAGSGEGAGQRISLVNWGIAVPNGTQIMAVRLPYDGVVNLTVVWASDGADVLWVLVEPQNGSGIRHIRINSTRTETTIFLPKGTYRIYVETDKGKAKCVVRLNFVGDRSYREKLVGIMPSARLAVWKVFKGLKTSTEVSLILEALEDILMKCRKLNITVVNISISTTRMSPALDLAVNRLVSNGILVVTPAGNHYVSMAKRGEYYHQIFSPGTAAYAITVAAANSHQGIAIYSSRGGVYGNASWVYIKPDIMAFGGGLVYGEWPIGADSDTRDFIFPDLCGGDYQTGYGTSYSAAYVSGILAMVTNILVRRGEWSWTLEDALRLKALLLATSYETRFISTHEVRYERLGVSRPLPEYSNGSKDYDEGFGLPYVRALIESIEALKLENNYTTTWIVSLRRPVRAVSFFSKDLVRISVKANRSDVVVCIYRVFGDDGSPYVVSTLEANSSETILASGWLLLTVKIRKGTPTWVSVNIDVIARRISVFILLSSLCLTMITVALYVSYRILSIIIPRIRNRTRREDRS